MGWLIKGSRPEAAQVGNRSSLAKNDAQYLLPFMEMFWSETDKGPPVRTGALDTGLPPESCVCIRVVFLFIWSCLVREGFICWR